MAGLDKRFPYYRKLLRLYPEPYRKAYSEQMLQTLADMLDDTPGRTQRMGIWVDLVFDFPTSLANQQLKYAGGIMTHETPSYVRRNAIIGAALLAPFFIVIASNILSNHHVASSTAWNRFFFALIVILPGLAFLLNVATFLAWATHRKIPFWKSLFDFYHNWPTLLTAGLALVIVAFVPFHDSAHCVIGNPITEAQNWHHTWGCIQQG
jgi:hypothetical protein